MFSVTRRKLYTIVLNPHYPTSTNHIICGFLSHWIIRYMQEITNDNEKVRVRDNETNWNVKSTCNPHWRPCKDFSGEKDHTGIWVKQDTILFQFEPNNIVCKLPWNFEALYALVHEERYSLIAPACLSMLLLKPNYRTFICRQPVQIDYA